MTIMDTAAAVLAANRTWAAALAGSMLALTALAGDLLNPARKDDNLTAVDRALRSIFGGRVCLGYRSIRAVYLCRQGCDGGEASGCVNFGWLHERHRH